MVTLRRATLKLLSIAVGLLFTGAIFYSMHYGPRSDWTAPGAGKLPQEIVRAFMREAYDEGRGAAAARDYFSSDGTDTAPDAQDRRDGAPMPHEIRSVIAQGLSVVVVHHVAAARGEPAMDVIDIFRTKNGRIVGRERYPTDFGR